MKRLNRKGFTLVELLAVIIILAIVVGISIPAIMTTTKSAKAKAMDTAVEAIQTYMQEQYELDLLGDSTLAGDSYNSDHVCRTSEAGSCDAKTMGGTTDNILIVTGYNKNISALKAHLVSGRIVVDCVTLANPSDYEYSTTWTSSKVC